MKRPLEDTGGKVPGEGDGDMEVEIPLPDGSSAPEGAGEPMDLDVVFDRVIQHAQNEAMNEFLAGASRYEEVGGDVEAEGQGSSISVQFGGNQMDAQIAEGVCDELTGHPIAHDQVVEGIRTEMVQLETLEVGDTYWGGTLAGLQKRAIFRSSFWLRTVALFVSQHSHGGRRCSR